VAFRPHLTMGLAFSKKNVRTSYGQCKIVFSIILFLGSIKKTKKSSQKNPFRRKGSGLQNNGIPFVNHNPRRGITVFFGLLEPMALPGTGSGVFWFLQFICEDLYMDINPSFSYPRLPFQSKDTRLVTSYRFAHSIGYFTGWF
jgi:hypothetical protein